MIDNAEHVVAAVADLVSVLSHDGDGLAILVTSQRPLLVADEECYQLGPLPPTAAAALFRDRMRPGDSAGRVDEADVDRVCAAVDRLPLGIELAAGLTRTLSVGQLAQRADDRLRLLVGGPRGAGARHASLRAALDWSYALLDPVAARVLSRCGVFAGGWTLEAAEQVITGTDLDATEVAAALAELVDRCLVMVDQRVDPPRFGLLETVRDYAVERLRSSDEEDTLRDRHLAWCAEHVAAHNVLGADQAAALNAMFVEWPNLLGALQHAPGTPRAADGLRLAIALDDAWMIRGRSQEARRHYEALVDADGVSDGDRARALSNCGFACAILGATDEAARVLARAATLAAAAGDAEVLMRVHYHQGIAAIEGGRPRDAFDPLRRGMAIAVARERDQPESGFKDVLALAHLYAGELDAALELCVAANEHDRQVGYDHGVARGLINEATIRLEGGDTGLALDRVAEAETLARELADPLALANLRGIRGRAALVADRDGVNDRAADREQAYRQLGGALADADAAGATTDAHVIRLDLAELHLADGDIAGARRLLAGLPDGTGDHGLVWLLAQPAIATVTARDGDPDEAARILDACAQEYTRRGFALPRAVRRLDEARAELP